MRNKTELIQKLDAEIARLQARIDEAVDGGVIAKRTTQRDRMISKKAIVEAL